MQSFDLSQLLAGAKNILDVPAVHDMLAILPEVHGTHIVWPDLTFDKAWMLWGLTIIPVLMVLYWAKRQPSVGHSRLPRQRLSLGGVISIILLVLMTLGIGGGTAAYITALAHPQKVEVQPGDIVTVRDIHFGIDVSAGNMSENIGDEGHGARGLPPPLGRCGTINQWGFRKLDAALWATCVIAHEFPNDRKSLAPFDGTTRCCSPAVSSEMGFFDAKLRQIQLGDTQTNFEDKVGLFNTMLDFIKDKGRSASQVLLVFTDGDATLTDENIQRYVQRLKDQHVLLICGGPGSSDTVAQDPDSDALVKLCNQAGALRVDVSSMHGIQQIVDAIRKLPQTAVNKESSEHHRPVHEGFILLGILAWAFAALMAAFLGRFR